MPPWAWLAGIVGVSFLLLVAQVLAVAHPIAFVDELIYSNAGKRLAQGLTPGPPDVGYGYGLVYPILIAPIYALARHVPDAYTAIKVMNAMAFSLAAVPSYFLARQVARPSLALGVATLTVALPARMYASLVETESVALPVFLLATLAVSRCLQRPTAGRQLAALGAIALAVETRRQSLILVAALPLAIAIVAGLEGGGVMEASRRALRRYAVTWVLLGAGVLAVGVWAVSRDVSPAAALGPYEVLAGSYSIVSVGFWLRVHIGVLGLVFGVVPLVALPFGLALTLRRNATARERAVGATTLTLVVALLTQVALFASTPYAKDRVHEGYLFYIGPLLFTMLALWIEKGLPWSRGPGLVAVAVVIALPLLIPFEGVSESGFIAAPVINRLGFDPTGADGSSGLAGSFHVVALVFSACLAVWVLILRPRFAWVLIAITLAGFLTLDLGLQRDFEALANGQRALSSNASPAPADWIDRAIGKRDAVSILSVAAATSCPGWSWDRRRSEAAFQRAEFFNTRVERVLAIGEAPPRTALAVANVRIDPNGRIRPVGAPSPTLVLTDLRVPLQGTRVATDARADLALWRTGDGLRLDGVSERDVRRLVCRSTSR